MASLPAYVAAAKPVPATNRAPWYKTIAPTYAGIMLWFVFWQSLTTSGSPGGVLSCGLMPALIGLVVAALICHFLFYLVPGLLGMRTGLPLYIVGTSTYGVLGGFLMPGFLMGLLQFGWVAVNAAGVSALLCKCFGIGLQADGVTVLVPSAPHATIAAAFAVLAAFMGLLGIKYVARIATFLPLIPLVVLVILLTKTAGGIGAFTPQKIDPSLAAPTTAGVWSVLAFLSIYVVGFFATAGAAGTDIASASRDTRDVQLGGLTGIALATIVAGGLAILVIAGAYGAGLVPAKLVGQLNPVDLMNGGLLTAGTAKVIMILLAISSFPACCFSALIAANSFKTTMPGVNPFISVGIGTLVAIAMAVTGVADKVVSVFLIIGASFGPVCGAMLADYLLAGRRWAGPRAGFNPAGWISWIVGFAVGAYNLVMPILLNNVPALAKIEALQHAKDIVPVPPVAAFIVGFVLYLALAFVGLQSRTLPMPAAEK
jgi:cytosine permease